MSYLVREMWVYLAVGMLGAGTIVTWLARAYFNERLERAEQNWKTRSRALEDGANTKLRDVVQGYTEELEQNASQLSALTTDLQSQRARVSSLGDEASKWRTDFEELEEEHESTVARLRTLDDRLAAALEDSDQLDLERKRLRGELERRGSELTKAIEEASRLAEADQQTDELQARADSLGGKAKELSAEIEGLSAKTQELQAALDRATQTVAEREERIRELNPLEDEVREAREELELLRREYSTDVTRREEESTRLRSRVGELEPMAARVVVLGGQLSEKTAALTSLESQLAALSGFPDRLRASEEELARSREGARELEADVARLRGELERAKRHSTPAPSKTANGGQHMSDVRELVRDVVERPAVVEQPGGLVAARDVGKPHEPIRVSDGSETQARHVGPNRTEAKDDLKRIAGIGAKLESRLHGLGYLTYRQIAGWSQEDIDRVEHHLPGFPDRIRRDNWIGQARQLDAERKGDGASV